MDKEEATKIANKLLDWYGKPEEERWRGFTAVMQTYGFDDRDTLTKEKADKMLAQIMEKRLPATINGVKFAFKTAWMEDQDGAGRIIAEYVREQ